jgi:hypothetical protein
VQLRHAEEHYKNVSPFRGEIKEMIEEVDIDGKMITVITVILKQNLLEKNEY